MKRGFLCLAALAIAGFLVFPAAAQNETVLIPVTNSAKDTEILLAKLLKERLKLESSLKLVNDNPEDLRVQITLGADENEGIPRLVAVIDTAILSRDAEGAAIAQSVNMFASAVDMTFTQEQIEKLLRWANIWNARMNPIRVFIADSRVFTAALVLGTKPEPTTSDRVIGRFADVVRSWPAVLRDLRALELIPPPAKN